MLSDDARVRFAALVHDVGKGTTRAEILPRHHGHEARSAKLIAALCERLRIPKQYRSLAVAVARYHGLCHTIDDLRPETIIKLLTGIDAFRQPDRVEHFLLACEADYRGRAGREHLPYPQAAKLSLCCRAAQAVSATPFADQGLAGREIGSALRKARVDAVRQILQQP